MAGNKGTVFIKSATLFETDLDKVSNIYWTKIEHGGLNFKYMK